MKLLDVLPAVDRVGDHVFVRGGGRVVAFTAFPDGRTVIARDARGFEYRGVLDRGLLVVADAEVE